MGYARKDGDTALGTDAVPVRTPGPAGALAERLGIAAGGIAFAVFFLHVDPGHSRWWYAREMLGPLYPVIAWPAAVMAVVVLVSMAWRLVLWLTYRPAQPLETTDPGLPDVTVVVPAYNEGATVEACIRSILASDYPRSRLKVIAVDDGSADDTWSYMQRAAESDPTRVTLLRRSENGGKRKALYDGFTRAGTSVIVTVDSDTVLPRCSLRALVTPIVEDERVGAVAGRIEVLNRDHNILTRMLGVRYRIGFDFVRAYQSRLRSVFVCPGAFTAYRGSVIEAHLKSWRDHRFMGRPCHNGDDHHLTNIVLRSGFATVYQSNAAAHTMAPVTYKGLSLMYLRWARSNIRESLVYLAFAPFLAVDPRRWPAIVDAVARFVQIPLRLYLLPLGWMVVFLHPVLLARAVALTLAFSLVYAAIYLRSDRSLDSVYTLLYAVFSLLTLQWIYPAAAVTIRRNRWLTR